VTDLIRRLDSVRELKGRRHRVERALQVDGVTVSGRPLSDVSEAFEQYGAEEPGGGDQPDHRPAFLGRLRKHG